MVHAICEHNFTIFQQPRYFDGHHGGLPKPSTWKDHPDCSLCRDFLNYIMSKHGTHPDNKKDPRSAEEGTEYAFTLTMPPDYKPAKPLSEVATKILEFGLTNKPYQKACEWAYVLEHTEKGIPHIHGVYKTPSGRRISAKYFKRYWDLWDEKTLLGHGHKGGYHQKARHTESYRAYLEKEGVVMKNPPASPLPPDIISHV
jgi:hypothetical protein